MKPYHIEEVIAKMCILGYDKEVPLSVIKKELAEYVGVDKYRLRYTVETCVELGYFSWVGLHTLKINNEVKKE